MDTFWSTTYQAKCDAHLQAHEKTFVCDRNAFMHLGKAAAPREGALWCKIHLQSCWATWGTLLGKRLATNPNSPGPLPYSLCLGISKTRPLHPAPQRNWFGFPCFKKWIKKFKKFSCKCLSTVMLNTKIKYTQKARKHQFPKKIGSSYSARTLHLKWLYCVLLSIPDCYKPARDKQNPVPTLACTCYKPVIKSRQKWDWLQNFKLFYKLEGQIQLCRRHALRSH